MSFFCKTACSKVNLVFKSVNFKSILNNDIVNGLQEYEQIRSITRGRVAVLREMKVRSKSFDLKPQKLRRRNEWPDWNYNSEIYAFNKRLNEKFTELNLIKAFTHKSYTELQLKRRIDSDLLSDFKIKHNEKFINSGHQLCENFIRQYLRYFLRNVPEEGIVAISNYLLSDSVLAEMAKQLGCTDLILSNDFPVEKNTLANTLLALVGALEEDAGIEHTKKFIIDFILTYLQPIDIFDIWEIKNPEQVFNKILAYNNLGKCEFRILRQTGINTVIPCYVIGAYSNKKLLGSGPSRTIEQAKELAAYDSLRKFFNLTPAKTIFKYGESAYNLDFKSFNLENISIEKFTLENETKKYFK